MSHFITVVRVFLASPDDVRIERQIVAGIIDELNQSPSVTDKARVDLVAWDRPGGGTAMNANFTPQEALGLELPTPAECDIAIVIFWSRLGTPVTYDNKEYESGTHWELLNAVNSPKTETVIYVRTETKLFEYNDENGRKQYERLLNFLRSEFFEKDGKISRAINRYKDPEEFKQRFRADLERKVFRAIEKKQRTEINESHYRNNPDKLNQSLYGRKLYWFLFVVIVLLLASAIVFAWKNAEVKPTTLYFVVDATFQQTNFQGVRDQINTALALYDPDVHVGLRVYGTNELTTGCPNTEQLITVQRYSDVSTEFDTAIGNIVPAGNGSLSAAVLAAIYSDLAEIDNPIKLIVIPSSVDPLCDPRGGGILESQAEAVRRDRPNIDLLFLPVGQLDQASDAQLRNTANAFGGNYRNTQVNELAEVIQVVSSYGSDYLLQQATISP